MVSYIVTGYRRTAVMMTVEAGSEEEAIEKAKAGEYTSADTEPDGDIQLSRWTAQPSNTREG